jgi:hypothetical protein
MPWQLVFGHSGRLGQNRAGGQKGRRAGRKGKKYEFYKALIIKLFLEFSILYFLPFCPLALLP